jgi:hypothetical protein
VTISALGTACQKKFLKFVLFFGCFFTNEEFFSHIVEDDIFMFISETRRHRIAMAW